MKKYALALLLAALPPSAAFGQFCTGCINNSASFQTGAQFNISSGTILNTLTAGRIVTSTFTVSTITANVFIGSGTYLTGLNASQLVSGNVSSTVVVGNYYGVTGLGTVSSGTWNGTILGATYGGTGANLGTSGAGALPYFSRTGVMGVVNSPAFYGVLASTGTGGTPVWVSSPAVQGYNFLDLPVAQLFGSSLPAAIIVTTNSIPIVLGTSVQGNISGGAASLTTNLPISQLSSGTFPTSNAASSITVTGTTAGVCGGPGLLCAPNIHLDGRIYGWNQFNNVVYSTNISPGPLPSGVTIAAAQVSSGVLAGNVIASSVAATGISAGVYGAANKTLTTTYLVDGRASTVTVSNIALPPSQITAGTLPSNVLVPAANVQPGTLGGTVIASSVAASGVAAGACGDSTHYCATTYGVDGRATVATPYLVAGATGTAFSNVDNGWKAAQTFFSSITVTSALGASTLSGDGTLVTALQPANVVAGTLPSSVVASSVSIPFLTVASSVTASAFFGDGSHITGVPAVFSGGGVANVTTFFSSVTVQDGVKGGFLVKGDSVTAGAFFGDGSHLTGLVQINTYNVFTASQAFPGIALTYGINASTGVFSSSVSASGGFYGNLVGNASGSAGSIAAAGVNSGALSNTVIASSVAIGAITNAQVAAGVFPNITVYSTNVAAGALVAGVTITTANVSPGVNGPNELVQLTGAGALPAVSGVNLTNVASGKFGIISGNNGTLGVGTYSFAYTNQAVTISSMSVFITVQGSGGSSGTIWACCYGGSCVSVTSAQGAAIGSTYTGNGAVSVPAGGQIVLQITSTGESFTPTANTNCGYQ